jgi:hypothetical protein
MTARARRIIAEIKTAAPLTGTEGSNPASSTGESPTNLTVKVGTQ